jgi:hypothetical protein
MSPVKRRFFFGLYEEEKRIKVLPIPNVIRLSKFVARMVSVIKVEKFPKFNLKIKNLLKINIDKNETA